MPAPSELDARLAAAAPRAPAGFADRVLARVATLEARRRRGRRRLIIAASAFGAVAAAAVVVTVVASRRAPNRDLQLAAGQLRELGPGVTLEGPAVAVRHASGWRLDEGTAILRGERARVDTELGRVETLTVDGHAAVVMERRRPHMNRIVKASIATAAAGAAALTVYAFAGQTRVTPGEGRPVTLRPGDRALFTRGTPPLVIPYDPHEAPEPQTPVAPTPPVAVARRADQADGTRSGAEGDLAAILERWLTSRTGPIGRCFMEEGERGATMEGRLEVRARAVADQGRARVAVDVVPVAGAKVDARLLDCMRLAASNPALEAPGATGTAEASLVFEVGQKEPPAETGDKRLKDGDVVEDIEVGNSPVLGPKDAPITIFEFSDFECPYCDKAAMTMHKIVLAYGDKVRFVFKNRPLPMHTKADPAAQAAAAAHEQGKFWEMHDLLFSNQEHLDRPDLESYAQVIGLDMARFRRALDEKKFGRVVAEDTALADELGVRGTPTFVINGRVLLGAQPYERFQAIIDEELAKR